MANYHLDLKNISRGKGQSITSQLTYITGRSLYDIYLGKTYYHPRSDVLYTGIFLPEGAPTAFRNLDSLCHAVDLAERRWDARTGRSLIGSLPNELALKDCIEIVETFITQNFLEHGLCSIVSVHEGKNPQNPKWNNPHAHIIVPTRTVGPEGFLPRKDRAWNRKSYLQKWREDWAMIQNQMYERNGHTVRVSHERLCAQGIYDRNPTVYLTYAEWEKERASQRARNEYQKQKTRQHNELSPEQELDRSR